MINKEDIKNMFGQIETPEYNPSDDIKQKINQGYKIKPGPSRLKIRAVCAFALFAVVFMTGVMAVYAINEYNMRKGKAFDLDGNSYDIEYNIDDMFMFFPEVDEKYAFEAEFINWHKENNILVCCGISETRDSAENTFLPCKIIRDYDELKKYIDGGIFKLPEYLPDGFEFYEATIMFYLDKDFDFETAELTAHEEKFGRIYEKYYIPENPDNIESIVISYGKGYNKSCLFYHIMLGGDEPFVLLKDENTQSENMRLPQFQRSMLLTTDNSSDRSDSKFEFEFKTTTYEFYATNPISPPKQAFDFGNSLPDYSQVMYSIRATVFTDTEYVKYNDDGSYYYIDPDEIVNVSCEELIKIAESLK